MLNIIIQGILSLFLVFIMAFIAYSVYNNEYVKIINDIIMSGNKKIVPIFTGRFEFSNTQVQIETYNKNMLGYKDVNPSKNQNGGAEYSYNFWLFYHLTDDKINTNLPNKTDYIILFFKGSKIKTMNYSSTNYECVENGDKKLLIKNPLVKLRNDGKELLVEYNNINFPDTYNNNAKPLSCDSLIASDKNRINGGESTKINDALSSNKFGIKHINTDYYNNKFNMITIVFQENPSNEEVFNNIELYANDMASNTFKRFMMLNGESDGIDKILQLDRNKLNNDKEFIEFIVKINEYFEKIKSNSAYEKNEQIDLLENLIYDKFRLLKEKLASI
jgi:hypothetical protein